MVIEQFKQLVGNYNTTSAIMKSIESGNFPRFTILHGTYGTGKTTVADLIAKSLTCKERISAEPCNKCANCIERRNIIKYNIPTINTKQGMDELITNIFKLEQILDGNVVYILEEFELDQKLQTMLLDEFNQQPENIFVILTTTKRKDIRQELRSRAVELQFNALPDKEMDVLLQRKLKLSNYNFPPQVQKQFITNAKGIPRDLLKSLDFAISSRLTTSEINSFLSSVDDNEILQLFQAMNNSTMDGVEYFEDLISVISSDIFYKAFSTFMRRFLCAYYGNSIKRSDVVFSQLSQMLTEKQVDLLLKLMRSQSYELDQNKLTYLMLDIGRIVNNKKQESEKIANQVQQSTRAIKQEVRQSSNVKTRDATKEVVLPSIDDIASVRGM